MFLRILSLPTPSDFSTTHLKFVGEIDDGEEWAVLGGLNVSSVARRSIWYGGFLSCLYEMGLKEGGSW